MRTRANLRAPLLRVKHLLLVFTSLTSPTFSLRHFLFWSSHKYELHLTNVTSYLNVLIRYSAFPNNQVPTMAPRVLVNKQKPSFKQQNLPAWQPILTAGTVLPTFFLIGVAFVPIGIGLLMSSTTVQEKIIDYTDCESVEQSDRACSTILPQACLVR